MIEARGLTKRFGDKLAVDRLTFTVEPGRITGFLGPNGAGKTTTMRLILGLDRPAGGVEYPDQDVGLRGSYPYRLHRVARDELRDAAGSAPTSCIG